MPLSLKVILVGERDSLADFQEMEPELSAQAIYSEYEENIQIADARYAQAVVSVGMAKCAAARTAGTGG
jgi:predicted ATP-dependent protease